MSAIKEITLFSQPGCGPCSIIKLRLERANIPFVLKDIQAEPDAKEELKGLGYVETPAVLVRTETGSYHFGRSDLSSHLSQLINRARR